MGNSGKKCHPCKAVSYKDGAYVCELGYAIDKKEGLPLEECPKPLLYLDLLELRKERIVNGNL